MTAVRLARIGVWVEPGDAYGAWGLEALAQTGLVFEVMGEADWGRLEGYDVLVLLGSGTGGDSGGVSRLSSRVLSWFGSGRKGLVAVGSAWGLEEFLGLRSEGHPRRGRTSLSATPAGLDFGLWAGLSSALGGYRLVGDGAEVLALDEEGFVGVSRRGSAFYVGVDVGFTFGSFLMGSGVTGDLIGPGDGSVETVDGRQRSEDGTLLEWGRDRSLVEGCDVPGFMTPCIDYLREAVLRLVLSAADATDGSPVLIWHLPDNADAGLVATIECDSGDLELVRRSGAMLAKFGVAPAWMVAPPGLSQDLYRSFKKWGHDLGHLYKPESGYGRDDQMRVQNLALARGAGEANLGVIKGWDGTWHGLTRLYEMAEGAGVRVSVCKGGRQPGTSGFLFGTGRPFLPMGRRGLYQVLEVPHLAFAPGLVTPFQHTVSLLGKVQEVYGVFHLAFMTSQMREEKAATCLHETLMLARAARLRAFTPSRLGEYERARRRVVVRGSRAGLRVECDRAVSGLTVMVGSLERRVDPVRGGTHVRRYGRDWVWSVVDLDGRCGVEVGLASAAA